MRNEDFHFSRWRGENHIAYKKSALYTTKIYFFTFSLSGKVARSAGWGTEEIADFSHPFFGHPLPQGKRVKKPAKFYVILKKTLRRVDYN
jgi:hypothetical protein